jgi:NAD-dependent dihydropyrimidine dehydrogenase PreA subunit
LFRELAKVELKYFLLSSVYTYISIIFNSKMNMVYYIGGALVALWLIGGTVHHLRRRGKIIRCNADNCTGCQMCLRYCRRNVLEAVKDEKGTRVIVKNPAHCTACGDCLRACKFNALKIVEQEKQK